MKVFVVISILLNILATPNEGLSQTLRIPLNDSALSKRQSEVVKNTEKFLLEFKLIESPMLGILLPTAKGVYPPNTKCAHMLVETVLDDINPSDMVLDMGCGSGVILVKIARDKGCFVHGVDIDENAVINSKLSAILAGVDNKVKIWKSNSFMGVPVDNKYDVIIFNSPLVVSMPFDMINIFDKKGEFLKHVLDNFVKFLTEQGRMYMMGIDNRGLRKILKVYRDRLDIFVFDEHRNKVPFEDFYAPSPKLDIRIYEIRPKKPSNVNVTEKKSKLTGRLKTFLRRCREI